MDNRLATVDMGRKGSTAVTLWGAAGSPGPRSASIPSDILIHPAVWPQQTWAENWGLLCPFLGGAGSPCNTMWPGPKPTPVPSGIWIHAAIWPQYMSQNWGCCASLFWGWSGLRSKTMSPGPSSTSVQSGILIHPAVWPEQTWAEIEGLLGMGS